MPTVPDSREQIAALLEKLTFPALADDAIDLIQGIEGDAFSAALERIVARGADWELRKEYVLTVTAAVSPITRQVIETHLGLRAPSLDILIEISKTEGRAFRTAIRQLSSAPDQLSPEADYLRRAIAPYTSKLPPPTQQASPHSRAIQPAEASPRPVKTKEEKLRPERYMQDAGTAKTERVPPYASTHIYGGQAAFCFSQDTTKGSCQPTLRIEATKAVGSKKYDWDQKVSFQCSVGELALIFGVFYGNLAKVDLSGHGSNNEKSLLLEDQGSSFFIRLKAGGTSALAAPIQARDTLIPMAMLFEQLKANFPNLSDQALLLLIKRVCDKHATPEQRHAA